METATATLLFSLFLAGVAAALIVSHLLAWRRATGRDLDERERTFVWRQFRRRMQASVMIAMVAVALPVGVWVPMRAVVFAGFWLVVVLVVLWIALLALADVIASRHHFGRIQHEQIIEHAKLHGELHRKRHKKNGRGAARKRK